MFRDRVTGQTVARLPRAVEHGRYIALVATLAGPVSIPADRHVTGVPGCLLHAPQPVDLLGVPAAGGDGAEKLLQLAGVEPFEDPAAIYPLVGEMTRGVGLSRAERRLEERIPTLFDVCHRPNTRLVSVEEVVWLARVKRLAPRGETWIDGHPETWSGWQRGVPMPSRAPASQPASDVDVYENRVTARLIDRRLLPKLNARIAALKSKRPAVESFRASTHAHYLLWSRLGELWDRWDVDEEQLKQQIDDTLGELETYARQVRRLRNTALYRGVPRNGSVPAVLRRTNVLRGDARYRRVGELWDAFRLEVPPTVHEQAQTAERLAVGHARFTHVLVARALRALEWDVARAQRPAVVVEKARDGNLCLRAPDAPPLAVVPLLFAGPSADLAERLPAAPDTLVVHAHRDDERPPGLAARIGETWFVATSPLDLNAVEAVGYAIHNHVMCARLGALPPEATVSGRLGDLPARLRLGESTPRPGGALYVVPGPLANLDSELANERRRAPRDRSAARAFELDLDDAGRQLREADARLGRALACPHPHCRGGVGRVLSQARERYVIECTVRDCGSRWGVQACSACARALPFFTLKDMSATLVTAGSHGVIGAQAVFGMLALGELQLAGEELAVRCSCGHAQPVSVTRRQ